MQHRSRKLDWRLEVTFAETTFLLATISFQNTTGLYQLYRIWNLLTLIWSNFIWHLALLLVSKSERCGICKHFSDTQVILELILVDSWVRWPSCGFLPFKGVLHPQVPAREYGGHKVPRCWNVFRGGGPNNYGAGVWWWGTVDQNCGYPLNLT